MKNITIREFVPEDNISDKDALLPAFLRIWNEDENLKYLSFSQKPFEQENVHIWLGSHKEQGVSYYCAVSESNEILGIAIIKINPIDCFEIFGVGVLPEFKRQGIGRKLIEHTISLAEKPEFRAIEASVFADNSPMLRVLISFNFIPVGMDYHKRADGADIVYMKRYL